MGWRNRNVGESMPVVRKCKLKSILTISRSVTVIRTVIKKSIFSIINERETVIMFLSSGEEDKEILHQ